MSKRAKKLHKISKRLTTHQLRRLQDKDIALGYDDLFGRNPEDRSSPYFLGYYSPAGIRYALEKYGVFKMLREKGFSELRLNINTEDPYKQRLALYFEEQDKDHMLAELVVKRKHITLYPPFPHLVGGRTFEVVAVEWLCMQNPFGRFAAAKPRLPGQKFPGLGMGEMIMELLVIMSGRLRTAGLMNVPEHFHNAQMYSPQFHYLHPEHTGKRLAIARDLLNQYTLSEVSWAIDLKCVQENGRPFEWFVEEQIIPLDRDLKDYFGGKEYQEFAAGIESKFHYSLDEKLWNRRKKEIENWVTC